MKLVEEAITKRELPLLDGNHLSANSVSLYPIVKLLV